MSGSSRRARYVPEGSGFPIPIGRLDVSSRGRTGPEHHTHRASVASFLVARVRAGAGWWLPLVVGIVIAVGQVSVPPANAVHKLYACPILETGWTNDTCKAHLSWADITWHFSNSVSAWPSDAKTAVRKGSYSWESGHALNLIEDSSSVNHILYDPSIASPFVRRDAYSKGPNHIDGFTMRVPTSYNNNSSLAHGNLNGLNDLYAATVHEWGHVIGLDHVVGVEAAGQHDQSNVGAPTGDPVSMCPAGATTCAGQEHTERRSLSGTNSVGDIGGRCYIYSTNHGYSC